jgi:hypothetical protein
LRPLPAPSAARTRWFDALPVITLPMRLGIIAFHAGKCLEKIDFH